MSEKDKNATIGKEDKRKAKDGDGVSNAKGGHGKKTSGTSTVTQDRLELLITVVDRNKSEYYIDLIQSFDVNMQFLALAHGTASAKMLGYLGLSESEKTVIFSVIQKNKIPDALAVLEEKFATIKNGKGIAYTVPFSSMIGTLIYGFLSNNRMAVKENR